MIQSLLNESVVVYRRISTAVDALGNPVYGDPTTGTGWNLVYRTMPARLAFTDVQVEFAPEGERVLPHGTLYFGAAYTVLQEDRIITAQNIQYVVTSVRIAYKTSTIIDHYEGILSLV